MPVYRFKVYDPTLQSKMRDFAQLHAFESRAVLKENYEKWLKQEDIGELITMEKQTLARLGYLFADTYLEKKLFTSIKYYHIKNILNGLRMRSCVLDRENSNIKKCTNQAHFSTPFIDVVKDYLTQKGASCKPAKSFVDFINTHQSKCDEEKSTLKMTDDLFDKKLKKMYKNQYYQISHKSV